MLPVHIVWHTPGENLRNWWPLQGRWECLSNRPPTMTSKSIIRENERSLPLEVHPSTQPPFSCLRSTMEVIKCQTCTCVHAGCHLSSVRHWISLYFAPLLVTHTTCLIFYCLNGLLSALNLHAVIHYAEWLWMQRNMNWTTMRFTWSQYKKTNRTVMPSYYAI